MKRPDVPSRTEVRVEQVANIPWPDLPRRIAPSMRAELPDLTEEVVAAIQRTIPEFARPLDGPYGRGIRLGVARALSDFVERIADPDVPRGSDPAAAEVYRALGRAEMREGRNLDALQAAYRLGARLAWRRWVRLGQRADVPAEHMYGLGEAVFAYVDELVAQSIEGYAEARARAAGELQRRRRRLLDLLLGDVPASPSMLFETARSAQWPLPTRVAAVALRPPRGAGMITPAFLSGDVLADVERPDPYLLVPDPEAAGRATMIERELQGRSAAIGPPVRLEAATASLYWARMMLALAGPGGGHGGVVRCTDHLSMLVMLADTDLIHALSQKRLAPMAQLTPKQRARVAETLLAWLECGGNAPEVARRIHVHPQTVRYRLRKIEVLFEHELRDPDARFELEVVLRARRLLGQLRRPAAAAGAGPAGAGAAASGEAGHALGAWPPAPCRLPLAAFPTSRGGRW